MVHGSIHHQAIKSEYVVPVAAQAPPMYLSVDLFAELPRGCFKSAAIFQNNGGRPPTPRELQTRNVCVCHGFVILEGTSQPRCVLVCAKSESSVSSLVRKPR